MWFGLKTSGATYQRGMYIVFDGLDFVIIYIDGIVMGAETFEELLQNLAVVCQRKIDAGIFMNIRKCRFGFRRIEALGYFVEGGRMYPDPKKIAKVCQLLPPTTVADVRKYLGIVNQFRVFVEDLTAR